MCCTCSLFFSPLSDGGEMQALMAKKKIKKVDLKQNKAYLEQITLLKVNISIFFLP